jgi:hypothetical protein
MKTLVLVGVVLFGFSGVAWADQQPPKARPACKVNALTSAERTESEGLRNALAAAVTEKKELTDGYELRLDLSRLPLASLSRWIDLERRCCPFFRFQVEVMPDSGPVWLRLTGSDGVKDVIRSAFKS